MRPELELYNVVVSANLKAPLESDASATRLLGYLGESLYDVWVEALVIALVLHIYFRLTRRSAVAAPLIKSGSATHLVKSEKAPKVALSLPKLPKTVVSSKHQGDFCKKQGGKSLSPSMASAEAMDISRFIADVVRRGGSTTPRADAREGKEVLERYEELVRARQVDLRCFVSEDKKARVVFALLIECGVRIAEGAGMSSAKTTTSRLVADMRSFGFTRDYGFYATIVKAHMASGLCADALWLYDLLVADGVSPSRTMYVYLLSAAVACNEDQRALAFFREVLKSGPAPMRTYMTILRVFIKGQDWSGAVEILEGLKLTGESPDARLLNTILGLCISGGETEVAEGLLRKWPDCIDVVSYNIVLKGHAKRANVTLAEALLRRMIEHGPKPNMISFNTVLDCAVRFLQLQQSQSQVEDTACAHRPWRLFDQVLEVGLEPDRYTCSTLVKGLQCVGCTAENIDRTIGLLRRLGPAALKGEPQGVACDSWSESADGHSSQLAEVLFNTLLDACASAHCLERMVAIFRMMSEFEVKATSVTFGTLIKAFGQGGQLQKCHEVWQDMLDAKVSPTNVTFGCYIDACVRHNDMDTAERVFRAMRTTGVRVSQVIFTTLIGGFARSKKPLKVLEVYKEMRCEGVDATTVTFNSVLDMVVRQLADPTHLQEVVDDMRSSSVAPDAMTYSILIRASCSIGQLDMAIMLFKQIRTCGLAFDEVAFNTLLRACSKTGRIAEAEEILAEMRFMCVAPTHVTTSILVNMYGKAKMLDKAIEVSRMAEVEHGVKPNLHVYTCLIQACVWNSQVRSSWEMFGAMLAAGVMPDAIAYGSVVLGCIYQNKFEQAMELVRHAYALPAPEGRTPLQSLGLATRPGRAGAAVCAPAPQRERPVQLQPDVTRSLLAALRRKSQWGLAAELEAIASTVAGL